MPHVQVQTTQGSTLDHPMFKIRPPCSKLDHHVQIYSTQGSTLDHNVQHQTTTLTLEQPCSTVDSHAHTWTTMLFMCLRGSLSATLLLFMVLTLGILPPHLPVLLRQGIQFLQQTVVVMEVPCSISSPSALRLLIQQVTCSAASKHLTPRQLFMAIGCIPIGFFTAALSWPSGRFKLSSFSLFMLSGLYVFFLFTSILNMI